jgi:hypothetical protein
MKAKEAKETKEAKKKEIEIKKEKVKEVKKKQEPEKPIKVKEVKDEKVIHLCKFIPPSLTCTSTDDYHYFTSSAGRNVNPPAHFYPTPTPTQKKTPPHQNLEPNHYPNPKPKRLPRKKYPQRASREVLSSHLMKMTRRLRLRRNGCRRGRGSGLVRVRMTMTRL